LGFNRGIAIVLVVGPVELVVFKVVDVDVFADFSREGSGLEGSGSNDGGDGGGGGTGAEETSLEEAGGSRLIATAEVVVVVVVGTA
jgi:hypothetical protein